MIRPKVLLRPDEAPVFLYALHCLADYLSPDCARYVRSVSPEQARADLAARRVELSSADASVWVQALSAVGEHQIREAGPLAPRLRPLIRMGLLRYRRSDPDEHWQTWREILAAVQAGEQDVADCEDLSAAYAAELRADGWDPAAHPVVYSVSPTLAHVVVRSPGYGAFFDPSRLAGM